MVFSAVSSLTGKGNPFTSLNFLAIMFMTALKDSPICEAIRVVSSLTPSSRRIVLVAICFSFPSSNAFLPWTYANPVFEDCSL
jgi:hypothetical protein